MILVVIIMPMIQTSDLWGFGARVLTTMPLRVTIFMFQGNWRGIRTLDVFALFRRNYLQAITLRIFQQLHRTTKPNYSTVYNYNNSWRRHDFYSRYNRKTKFLWKWLQKLLANSIKSSMTSGPISHNKLYTISGYCSLVVSAFLIRQSTFESAPENNNDVLRVPNMK